MKFTETLLAGAFLIDPELIEDDRGFFARTWCREEFRAHGLNSELSQCSVSFNRRQGTIRGMHWQLYPYEEAKLVHCTRGAIRDVIVDLRQSSCTFGQWLSVELDADGRRMLYIPEGFAHGFETLVDQSEVAYQISGVYVPAAARGFRWNDPTFHIEWRTTSPVLSERDRSYRDFVADRLPALQAS